jgi:hypothetical protein
MDKDVHNLIDKVKYERQKHINKGYDVERLIPLKFNVSQWTLILDYIEKLDEYRCEFAKYLSKNQDRYIYQDGLGEDWFFEDLDVFRELSEILDRWYSIE